MQNAGKTVDEQLYALLLQTCYVVVFHEPNKLKSCGECCGEYQMVFIGFNAKLNVPLEIQTKKEFLTSDKHFDFIQYCIMFIVLYIKMCDEAASYRDAQNYTCVYLCCLDVGCLIFFFFLLLNMY